MSYTELQKANAQTRKTLSSKNQKWLKANDYKNIGWDNIIKLYQKLNEFLPSLEDLFLEADRIGNKYQTAQEISDFNQKMSKEVEEISELIDRQFPDDEIEIIDFSSKSNRKSNKKHFYKNYRTIKV